MGKKNIAKVCKFGIYIQHDSKFALFRHAAFLTFPKLSTTITLVEIYLIVMKRRKEN